MYDKQHAELLQWYRAYVNKIYPLSDEDFFSLGKFLKFKHIKKGDILLEEGKVCKYFWFVGKGCLRLFLQKGNIEINVRFFFENSIASNFASLHSGEPSKFSLVAMEDCTVLSAYRPFYKAVINVSKPIVQLSANFYQQSFFTEIEHSNSFKILNPEERYQYLLAKQPSYLQRIPLVHLASYLGMSRKTLCRIRSLTPKIVSFDTV